jgi:hypothetical protein
MLVYVAAKYQAIQFARDMTAELHKQGHIVISTWHTVMDTIKTDLEARIRALTDLDEIRRCDIFLLLPENKLEWIDNKFAPVTSVGRYAEIGMALALSKRVLIPNDHRPFIFSCMCEVYNDWQVKECLKAKSQDS